MGCAKEKGGPSSFQHPISLPPSLSSHAHTPVEQIRLVRPMRSDFLLRFNALEQQVRSLTNTVLALRSENESLLLFKTDTESRVSTFEKAVTAIQSENENLLCFKDSLLSTAVEFSAVERGDLETVIKASTFSQPCPLRDSGQWDNIVWSLYWVRFGTSPLKKIHLFRPSRMIERQRFLDGLHRRCQRLNSKVFPPNQFRSILQNKMNKKRTTQPVGL